MIKIAGSLPVKTRVPLAAWILAGLVTILSTLSSLIQFATGSTVAEQIFQPVKEVHHASVD